jgi:hypothetical protein
VLKSLVRSFIKTSVLNKGLRGNSTAWLIIGAFSVLKRLYNQSGGRTETLALREKIRPGDELIVKYPGAPDRGVRKEINELGKRRTAAAAERAAVIGRLQTKADKGGFGAKKAARELATMTGSGSMLSKAVQGAIQGAVSGAANGLRGGK